jgi:hypothetical protein
LPFLLSQTPKGRALKRAPDTRLIFIPLVAARFIEMLPNCRQVVSDMRVTAAMKNRKVEQRNLLAAVAGYLQDTEFILGMRVLANCFLPLVYLARELDRGECNFPLVKVGWLGLAANIGKALNAEKDLDVATKRVIMELVEKDYTLYEQDIDAATFILHPGFFELWNPLRESDRSLFIALRRSTLSVFWRVLRRFNPDKVDVVARDEVLSYATPENAAESENADAQAAAEHYSLAMQELDLYLTRGGDFTREKSLYQDDVPPAVLWANRSPGDVLPKLAKMILTLQPTTGEVERDHKVGAQIHTAKRNRLSSSRVLGMTRVKIACASQQSKRSRHVRVQLSVARRFFSPPQDEDREELIGVLDERLLGEAALNAAAKEPAEGPGSDPGSDDEDADSVALAEQRENGNAGDEDGEAGGGNALDSGDTVDGSDLITRIEERVSRAQAVVTADEIEEPVVEDDAEGGLAEAEVEELLNTNLRGSTTSSTSSANADRPSPGRPRREVTLPKGFKDYMVWLRDASR